MPENWKTYELGDIISIRGGFSYKGKYIGSGDSLLLGMGCVSNSKRFLISGARPYSGDCRSVFFLNPGDMVLATRQQSDNLPIIGLPAIVPPEFEEKSVIGGTNLFLIKNQSKIDNRFLYWLLKSPMYKRHMKSVSSGTTVRMITKDAVELFRFDCPPKEERLAISNFLWQIDDKIENNLAMNKTLEDMAMALYKHWFLDFGPFQKGTFIDSELGPIPEGWEVKKIGEIAKNKKKSRPVVSIEAEEPYVALEHIDKGSLGIKGHGRGEDSTSNKSAFSPFDILFGKLRPYFKKVAIPHMNGICSTDILVIQPVKPIFFGNLVCTVFSDEFIDYTTAISTGTRMPRANWKGICKYKIALPTKDKIVNEFNDILHSHIQQIHSNIQENQTLTNLRDTLLPKLISGEVRVKDIEKTIGEVV